MSINLSSTVIGGQTGSIGTQFAFGANPTLEQVFNGTPQFYPGSMVQIEEIVTIVTSVVDEKLVDIDFGWWQPHRYLGTFQVIDSLGSPSHYKDDDGYLVDTIQKVRRYSWYTITANPSTVVAQHEQIALDTCNFYLQPDVYLFPGQNTPVTGFRTHDLNPAFLGSVTLSKAPLVNSFFTPQIGGIGLYLKPGVEGVQINYEAAVINTIKTDYPSATVPNCVFIEPNCQFQFSAFLAQQPTVRFETQSACQISQSVPCAPSTWVCPTTPTETFVYWSPIALD
jgi:hypothetical protein